MHLHHVEVVVLGDGGEGLVDLRDHGGHALGCRRPGGQEAHVGASLLEGAVGDEAVEMHVEPRDRKLLGVVTRVGILEKVVGLLHTAGDGES